VRGIFTGVLRVVSVGGLVYLVVPGLSYLHTRVKRATPAKTAGEDSTGGFVWVSVQGSDESWIPDRRSARTPWRRPGRSWLPDMWVPSGPLDTRTAIG
jgi:hypothetical protein